MRYGFPLFSGLLAAALAMPAMAWADDAHHPDKANPPAAIQSKAPAPEQTVKKMQGNVKKMQAQLDRLGKARNDDEFNKILAEHMQTMRENMMLGQGMAGMDCAAMGGGMHGMMGGGAGHEAMMERMNRMEQRMDMMERMNSPAAGK